MIRIFAQHELASYKVNDSIKNTLLIIVAINSIKDNEDNNNDDGNDMDNNNDTKIFFTKVSCVIHFRNHRLKSIRRPNKIFDQLFFYNLNVNKPYL